LRILKQDKFHSICICWYR